MRTLTETSESWAGETKTSDANRLLFLRVALVVIGLTFIFGVYTLSILWPSGWVWGEGYSHYLMMLMGVYATLGVFLLIASRNPYAHKSLIWFTVWSSAVHGAIMGVQALSDATERGHLVGDAPALILVAIILAVLMPKSWTADQDKRTGSSPRRRSMLRQPERVPWQVLSAGPGDLT